MSFLIPLRFAVCERSALLLLTCSIATVPAHAQNSTMPMELRLSGSPNLATISREIDDPASGARWLLVRSGIRPGGPGRLVLVGDPDLPAPDSHLQIPVTHSLVPVIRAGDALLLEEHTAAVDLEFEAIALGPARIGNRLRVRLELGGRMVNATATSCGHATLASGTETWPE